MFRIEDKIPLNKFEVLTLLDSLKSLKAEKIYPSRSIKSIYFDDSKLTMFLESEEGIVPRKKIRIRSYNDEENYLLETKISSPEGRYKISKEILPIKKDFYLKNGYFDNKYGICLPVSEIIYTRDYFMIEKIRVTLDTFIKFKGYKESSFNKSDKSVLEIKTSPEVNLDVLDNIILGRKARFSKYVISILSNKIFEKKYNVLSNIK